MARKSAPPTASARPAPSLRRRIAVLAVLAVLASLGYGTVALLAQEDSPAPAPAPAATAKRTITPPPATVFQKVDKAFESAVNAIYKVLFFPIGATERTYVEFTPAYYYRPAGSEGEFQSLTGRTDPISDGDYRVYDALGKLTAPLKVGKLDGKPVDYFAYAPNSGKYVLHDGRFRKAIERENLSDTETLTREQVDELGEAGRFKVDANDNFLLEEDYGGAPIVVLWLSLGAVYFTIYLRFFNFRGFSHAIEVVRGKYDNPDEPGEVTHLQALSSALSATVGLGNIAGVTIAMQTGGPGAFFWMLCCGFFGMSSKFVESTLGQKYRKVSADGTVRGGPMEYLKDGFAERGMAPLGLLAGMLFTVMCVLASFGGGNMFQANQAGQQMLALAQSAQREEMISLQDQIAKAHERKDSAEVLKLQEERSRLNHDMANFKSWFLPMFGVIFAILVGVVIIGGIKRIGAAAEKVVPAMCGIYLVACLYIIAVNFGRVPEYIGLIFSEAFNPQAFGGGLLGVLIVGVRRAAFSNEAGVGSAAIAHSAAKTEEPIREGTVALLGPFIDTIVVCSMTALVVLITGAWNHQDGLGAGLTGSALTSEAFASVLPWFRYVLSAAVVLFAYSTLISWSYYGEKCWETLFGARAAMGYKVLFVVAVFVGSIANLGAVLDFSDMMILSMAFPNILGLLVLSPSVKRDLEDYWRRYKANEFRTFK
ncbi:MAG: alanine:cation symporter family protein [Planctomycetales bacterium]|nr:alanine:cation symporter family protein [Planctomycetales bacterium]